MGMWLDMVVKMEIIKMTLFAEIGLRVQHIYVNYLKLNNQHNWENICNFLMSSHLDLLTSLFNILGEVAGKSNN